MFQVSKLSLYFVKQMFYVCVNAAGHFFLSLDNVNMSNGFILKPIRSSIVSNRKNYN